MTEDYKYRCVEVNLLDTTGEKILNDLGAEGWRVLETHPHPHHQGMFIALLERVDSQRTTDLDPVRVDCVTEACEAVVRIFKETGGQGPIWGRLTEALGMPNLHRRLHGDAYGSSRHERQRSSGRPTNRG